MSRFFKEHKGNADPQSTQAEMQRAFSAAAPPVPDAMSEEIFEYFFQRAPEGDTQAAAALLGDVADLLGAEYDEQADPLAPEDWEFMKEVVSEYAAELDMDLVNYVMKLVVAHGGFR